MPVPPEQMEEYGAEAGIFAQTPSAGQQMLLTLPPNQSKHHGTTEKNSLHRQPDIRHH